MRRAHADILSGLGFLAIAVGFWFAGRDLTGISVVFPMMLEIFLAAGGVGLIINGLRISPEAQACADMPIWRRVWLMAASSLVYTVCVSFLGFYVSSAGFLFVMSLVFGRSWGRRQLGAAAAFSVLVCVVVYLVFRVLLLVPTPQGLFF